MMKSILLTGSTGFIAGHLIPRLTDQGWFVRAALRHASSQLPTGISSVVTGNIDNTTNWNTALQGIDTVIHLAARAHILHDTSTNPDAEFLKVNTDGTANLVQQSLQAGVKHFIFISSVGAMATFSTVPLSEESACQPDTPYGRSKLKAEQALIDLTRNHSMNWTILRPTLVYGPGNPGNMERLMKLVNRGIPLPLGGINNQRSFVYVGNLVDAITTCIQHPKAGNQLFLVSDGKDLSTPELVQKIAQAMDYPCKLLPVPPALLKLAGFFADRLEKILKRPLPLNTSTVERLVGSLVVDSSRIRSTLNWHPPFTVEEGLAKTLHSRADNPQKIL